MCPMFAVMKNTVSPFSFYTAQTNKQTKPISFFIICASFFPTFYISIHLCHHLIIIFIHTTIFSFEETKMHFQKVIVFVLLITFLVCGEENEDSSIVEPQRTKTQKKQKQNQHQPFSAYFSQMRRVPNASDPLHNR